MTVPRVLVTGATGTVGSEVVAGLADRHVTVRAAARDTHEARERLGYDVEYVSFDFEKPETYYPALEGVDRVFLVRPPAISRVGEHITPFCGAAVRMGVERVVLLSVIGAEKNPVVPHRRIERHLESLDVETVFLRASFFMQNLAEVHRQDIVEDDAVFVPAGAGATSFVDARDVAAVGVESLTRSPLPERVAYDVTGPIAIDYQDVAAILSDVLGREITYPAPSIPAFVRRMRSRGHDWGYVLVMVGIYTTARLGLAARVTDDLATVLGRPPRSFREFAADYRTTFEPSAGDGENGHPEH
jgi:uncharacterized protein YbjT (DUF2867 family)